MSLLGGLNWLDILILALLLIGMGVGYVQGLLRQVIALATLYIGAILGAQYYVVIANWIRAVFPNAPGRIVNAAGFLTILLFVTSLLNWLAYDAYQSTRLRVFPIVDHLGGALLGLLTTTIIITIALPVVTFATVEVWPWAENGRLILIDGLGGSHLLSVFDMLKPTLLNALAPWLPGGLPSIFNI